VTTFATGIASVSDEIELQREAMRSGLGYLVIGLVALISILLVSFVWANGGGDAAKLLVTGVFTPLIGIAGTVLGFYFGKQAGD
jgi:hypothetical protein